MSASPKHHPRAPPSATTQAKTSSHTGRRGLRAGLGTAIGFGATVSAGASDRRAKIVEGGVSAVDMDLPSAPLRPPRDASVEITGLTGVRILRASMSPGIDLPQADGAVDRA